MQRYQHGTETLYFEDGVTPAEMEQAAMRVDQQRAAADRAYQTQNMLNQIKQLAGEEERAEEAAAQRRPEELRAMFAGRGVDEPPSYIEKLNDRNRAKMSKEDFEDDR